MAKTALVVGASGIVGSATANLLAAEGWAVHGLARRPIKRAGVQPVAADLQDAGATAAALRDLSPDAVFITTCYGRTARRRTSASTQPWCAICSTACRSPPARATSRW